MWNGDEPFAVEIDVSKEAPLQYARRFIDTLEATNANLVSGPREHGKGNRNGDIDPDLPDLDLRLEFTGDGPRLSENGRAITERVRVNKFDG